MKKNDHRCECSTTPKLIFSCSGAADVGELADQAARKMTKDGIGKMFCLAGIGGGVSGILKTAESAQAILALDGCPLNCAKKCLEENGFKDFMHLRVVDLGLKKGETEVNDVNIKKIIAKGSALLQTELS